MNLNGEKVLLTAINAKYIHSNLAVYSLRANAGEYSDQVGIVEYTINHRKEEILQAIYRRSPEVVGFSCYIWNIRYVLDGYDYTGRGRADVPPFFGMLFEWG